MSRPQAAMRFLRERALGGGPLRRARDDPRASAGGNPWTPPSRARSNYVPRVPVVEGDDARCLILVFPPQSLIRLQSFTLRVRPTLAPARIRETLGPWQERGGCLKTLRTRD